MVQLIGTTHNGDWDGWYGPSGRDGSYKYELVRKSVVADALREIGMPLGDNNKLRALRKQTEIKCAYNNNGTEPEKPCKIKNSVCLFNIKSDPCEVY